MQIIINLDENVIAASIKLAAESDLTFEQYIEQLLEQDCSKVQTSETGLAILEEDDVDEIVSTMVEWLLINAPQREVVLSWIHRKACANDISWRKIEPGSRKVLGRRFKAAIDLNAKEAQVGASVIVCTGKTNQNALLYKTVIKTLLLQQEIQQSTRGRS